MFYDVYVSARLSKADYCRRVEEFDHLWETAKAGQHQGHMLELLPQIEVFEHLNRVIKPSTRQAVGCYRRCGRKAADRQQIAA